MDAMMQEDMLKLQQCEQVIEAHMTATDLRTAVATIREQCLYRARGYASFEEYCRGYWGDQWIKLQPVEVRRELVAEKRAQGKSLRIIGGELGISKDQADRDLRTVSTATVPDRIMGRDGKERPAKRRKEYRKKGDPEYKKPHIDHSDMMGKNLLTLESVLTTFDLVSLSKADVTVEWLHRVHEAMNKLRRLEAALERQLREIGNGD